MCLKCLPFFYNLKVNVFIEKKVNVPLTGPVILLLDHVILYLNHKTGLKSAKKTRLQRNNSHDENNNKRLPRIKPSVRM